MMSKPSADDWLRAFGARLAPLPEPERADLIAEHRAHLHETGESPDRAFGDPTDYAQRFLSASTASTSTSTASAASTASASASATATSPSWRVRIGWSILALPALAMLLAGLILLSTAACEPFVPEQAGLFVRDGAFVGFGIIEGLEEHDVLGVWLIPAAGVPGAALFYAGLRLLDLVRRGLFPNAPASPQETP